MEELKNTLVAICNMTDDEHVIEMTTHCLKLIDDHEKSDVPIKVMFARAGNMTLMTARAIKSLDSMFEANKEIQTEFLIKAHRDYFLPEKIVETVKEKPYWQRHKSKKRRDRVYT